MNARMRPRIIDVGVPVATDLESAWNRRVNDFTSQSVEHKTDIAITMPVFFFCPASKKKELRLLLVSSFGTSDNNR
jgi:hypothetical protein